MYTKGMTTRQIFETIEDIYEFETSKGIISHVTDKILPQIEDWQNRSLDEICPILYIDAIHYPVRDNKITKRLAAYPNTEYQRFIVHQIRNSLKYVPDEDIKAFSTNLKTIFMHQLKNKLELH